MATRGIFQRKKENLARSKEMQKKKEKENSDDSSISNNDNNYLNNKNDDLDDSSLQEKSKITNSDFDVKDAEEKNYEEYKSELDSILQNKKKKLEDAYKFDKDKYEEKSSKENK